MDAFQVLVRSPRSQQTRVFKSVRAVARMLSGNGTASGGLRRQIANTVEYNWAEGTRYEDTRAVRNNVVF